MLRVTPKGEDGIKQGYQRINGVTPRADEGAVGAQDGDDWPRGNYAGQQQDINYLHLVSLAESSAQTYLQQINRRAWSRAYRAFHNQHFDGSKYHHKDWARRSKNFVPKTRTFVKKDMAAVAASLFGTIDAIACTAGNDSDPRQRAAAAVMQELVNYRTDRTSGRSMSGTHTSRICCS